MATWILCPCGNQISTGSFPNPGVNYVVSEQSYDAVPEPADVSKLRRLFLKARELVECGQCGRMLLSTRDGAESDWYAPEPIRFDVWGALSPEHEREGIEILGRMRPELDPKEIVREVADPPGPEREILIVAHRDWSALQTLREELTTVFERLQIYQADFGPHHRPTLKECPTHRIYYSGARCPVCRGRVR